jgi:hypothetical protein
VESPSFPDDGIVPGKAPAGCWVVGLSYDECCDLGMGEGKFDLFLIKSKQMLVKIESFLTEKKFTLTDDI